MPEPEKAIDSFPVDKLKLKKAIKAALIRNDNDPSKLDLGVILREQMKMQKNVQEFRTRKKQIQGSEIAKGYYCSKIMNKMRE